MLGLGPRAEGRPYAEEDFAFLRSVAACAATPIENGLIYDELRRVNQRLSVKIFQLHNLFDISRELTASLEEDAIKSLFTTTVMGQFVVSRCALYLPGPGGLGLVHERGTRSDDLSPVLSVEALHTLASLRGPTAVKDLPEGLLKERLLRSRMGLAVPLTAGTKVDGLLAVGDRASGAPFTEEDHDFAQTLARQALAALESARLHRMQLEKQRQDRELQIAREIQQSLFPSGCPADPGLRGGGDEPPLPRSGGRLLRLHPLERGPAGPGRGRRLREGNAGQHPHGFRSRLSPGPRGNRAPRRPHVAPQPFPVREHTGQQVRDRLLCGARPSQPAAPLRERRARAAVPGAERRARGAAVRGRPRPRPARGRGLRGRGDRPRARRRPGHGHGRGDGGAVAGGPGVWRRAGVRHPARRPARERGRSCCARSSRPSTTGRGALAATTSPRSSSRPCDRPAAV